LLTFDFSYLRVAPHKYWWGRTVKPDHAMNLAPPEDFAWTSLGVEPSGGEACDVLDSAQRGQRLWVGRDSGRLRRVLSYYPRTFNEAKYKDFYASEAVRRIAGKEFETQQAYYDWCRNEATDDQTIQLAGAWSSLSSPTPDRDLKNVELNELAVFDDYREVAPGIWIPFREIRTNWLSSDVAKGKCEIMRTELRVEEVRTDRDLAARYAELMPKEGDPVQDQRFRVAVDTKYSAATGDDEIRKRADAEYAKMLEGQEHLKRLVAPIDAMVGKPAPALPAEGWIGGPPPAVAGKPYLLHFWATWCGPCKNDLPRLKTLAEQGVVVVGMHPRGTPAEEVEKAIRDDAFGGPTYLEPGAGDDAGSRRIAGYPSGVFPYYLVVDARGRVAGHGSLHEILTKFGAASLIARPDDPRDR
jgi:thiol-disulfide isomerase/thioredoxin